MIRKSGYRFSEKDHAQTKKMERDDGSKNGHHAPELNLRVRGISLTKPGGEYS
jgi:hypothetical protein